MPMTDEYREAQYQRELAQIRRETERSEKFQRTMWGVISAPFVLGGAVVYAVAIGAVWLFGAALIVGAVAVAYKLLT